MSLDFLQSSWEIWESPNPDHGADRIGATMQFVGKYNMTSWDERRASERKEEQSGTGHRPQLITETLSELGLGWGLG